MAEGDVNTGDFLILKNISDNAKTCCVCADRKFTNSIAVLVRTGVVTKFFQQSRMLALQSKYPIVLHIDNQWRVLKIAILTTEVIANHSIDHKPAVGVRRRC